MYIVSKGYHGEVFEGNACRKLLKEADLLNDTNIYKEVGYFQILPYISAFKAMNKIVDCCFTAKAVGPNLDKLLKELSLAVKATQVSETLKIHVLLEHIKDCLQFLPGTGLGAWSEQSGEAVHKEFLHYWSRYKINSLKHTKYADHLKKAVVKFSAEHIKFFNSR